MKIVVLSTPRPREWVVVQEVLRQFNDVVLIKPIASKRENHAKTNKTSRFSINRFGVRIFRKIHKERLRFILKKRVYKGLQHKEIEFPNHLLNKPEGKDLITSLEPDVLFTCWAPILRENIFTIPKKCAINVHYGIPPDYRGNDTLFWAFLNREYDKIGGCIHYLSKGVDQGNVLSEVYPELDAKDGELSMDIKTTVLLAKAAVKVLEHLAESPSLPNGKPQEVPGRNYKRSERDLKIFLTYAFKRLTGKLRAERRPERMEFYF